MSNPLMDLQKLVQPKSNNIFRAKVISVEGQKVKVELAAGNNMIVWGSAKINDTVLVNGRQITAIVGVEKVQTVFVP